MSPFRTFVFLLSLVFTTLSPSVSAKGEEEALSSSFFQKYFKPLHGEPHEHEDGAITLLKTRASQGGTVACI